jgi:hypothetical protein
MLRAALTLLSRRDTDSTLNRFVRLIAGMVSRKRDGSVIAFSRRRPPHAAKSRPDLLGLDSLPGLLLLSVLGPLAVLPMLAAPLAAQRVQFPTPSQPLQPADPYTPPPPGNFPAPPPGPYPTTPYSPSPYSATPVPAAPYSPSAVGPPPLFDPYASGNTVAPPPPAVPYTPPAAAPFTPPPPAAAAPPPAPLFPGGAPFQWQPAPYDIATSGEGYWAKTQRFLQELSFEYTYLYGDHSDPFDFEINRVELSSTFAFPMFYNIQTPLLVTPGFAFNFLEGPISGGADLPAQLYDAYLDLAWYPRWYEWLGGELGFRTGVWSDFDHVNSDSVRLLGRGLASVALTPNLDILFGAVYLDRIDVKLLPAGGFYYRPTPEWDMYLVFPNPKVRRFVTSIGNTRWYAYGAGEYGGGSWTVHRDMTAINDHIDYNDIRVIGGLEWETQSFIRGHIEVGYVWDREIIFVSGMPPSFTPDDTIMLRAGIDF